MRETARPTTKRTPLVTSAGILVKGRKKTGKSTITKKSDKNESLLKILVFIIIIISISEEHMQVYLYNVRTPLIYCTQYTTF